MNVAFCIPNMVIGGVETVFIRTLDEMLNSIASDPAYKDIRISVITHAKIMEPLYVKWFKDRPEIETYVCYPLQNMFEGMAAYTNFFPLRQLRKVAFSFYKKYKRFKMRNMFKDIDVFIDYKNVSFFKELQFIKKRKIAWIHGTVGYLSDIGVDKHLNFYDKIIGLTDDFVIDFKKKFPDIKDKVTRIYNPIDIQSVIKMAQKGERFAGRYFCHVSRLEDVQKDLKTLLFAFEDFYVNNNNPDINLLIIGGGPKEKSLKKMAASLKSAKNIVFTGILRNPFGYMSGAMATILSSKIEGLPTVLVESMALGTLCVSADCQYGPRELLLDGKAGILFEVGNIKQLSDIMTDIYKNNLDVSSFVKNAKKSLQRFCPGVINKQIMDLL